MASIVRRLMHFATRRLHPNRREDCDVSRESSRVMAAEASVVFQSPRISSHLQQQQQQQQQQEQDDFSFEVDWSGFSVGVAFQELMLGLLGLPSPFPKPAEQREVRINRSGFRQPDARLHKLYLRRELHTGAEAGFLIRGIIYDMAAVSTKMSAEEIKAALQKQKQVDSRDSRDWSSHLHGGLGPASFKPEDVSATEVMDKLGVKNVLSGLQERVASGPVARKKVLEAKQALEENMGRGDSIRAKYAERLKQKKMMADSRREQSRFSVEFPTLKVAEGMECRCLAASGSPALVRYLQERGVVQGLLTRGRKEDFVSLMDQLGNVRFDEVKPFEGEGMLSEAMLTSMSDKWGLLSKQIMVVVPNDHNPGALKRAADKGFFVCRVQSQRCPTQEDDSTRSGTDPASESGAENKPLISSLRKGVRSWFNKLAEGTLHVESEIQKQREGHTHFSVLDMTELKWVIEDMNGVSYRPATFVRGFQ